MPDFNTARFKDALQFATDKHCSQVRKGTAIPYIAHLLQVAGLVLENGGDEDEAIAGLLHDVVEDQDVTPDELEQRFGARVRNIVVACSDSAGGEKPEWKQRKLAYIEHVAHASKSVRLVSSCDKLHNARAILADYEELGDALWARFNSPKVEILWYYNGLVEAFGTAEAEAGEGKSRVVGQLKRVVAEIDALAL